MADARRNTVFRASNIPFESEEKQKFQITKSTHAKKYSLTLDNFSPSSQQLVPNYIFFILAYTLTSISEGFWPNSDQINISPIFGHFLHE